MTEKNIRDSASSSSTSSEKSPLLSNTTLTTQPQKNDTFWHEYTDGNKAVFFWDKFGSVCTFMAMVPQGIFGGLWIDNILREAGVHIVFRIAPGIFVCIAAEEGKRRLVRFFNTQSFKDLADLGVWQQRFSPASWRTGNSAQTAANIVSALIKGSFTVVGSSVFALLAAVSFNNTIPLLSKYQNPYTDKLITLVRNPGFQAPFASASFVANLLGFYYGIIPGAMSLLQDLVYFLVENPEYRKLRNQISMDIEQVRLALKDLVEKGNNKSAQELIDLLRKKPNASNDNIEIMLANVIPNTNPVSLVKEQILTVSHAYHNRSLALPSSSERLLTHFLATGFSALGIVGLYNFRKMTLDIIAMLHLPYVSTALHWLAPILSIMDYTAMSLLAFNAIYRMVLAVVGRAFGRDPALQLVSGKLVAWTITKAVFICALGGSPNAEQSLLANENIAMQILAILSSFLIELFGYYMLSINNANQAITNQDPVKALALKIDAALQQARDDRRITAAELAAFRKAEKLSMRAFESDEEDIEHTKTDQEPVNKKNNDIVIDIAEENVDKAKAAVPAQYRPSIQSLLACFGMFKKQPLGTSIKVIMTGSHKVNSSSFEEPEFSSPSPP